MNKELIKKYKAEFDHWLNGGKLLHKDEFGNWENSRDIWDLRTESIKAIVINDSYSIYRKAMAEGQIVQEQDYFNKQWLDMKTDDFHGASDTQYEGVYRVKPERHKFKVGDWVIHNGVVKRVTKAIDGYIDSLDNEVAVIMKEESLELWEPKEEEEYFWYKNDLVKFDEIKTNCGTLLNSARGCSYYPAEKNFEDYCEPFIGQLPTSIKD